MIEKKEHVLLVAKYGGLQKAAEELYITPSALSKSIAGIEASLDVKLFDRVGKKFILTYAGERYLAWLDKFAGLEHEMKLEMSGISRVQNGRIRVGIQLGGVEDMMTRVLSRFNESCTGFSVELLEASNKKTYRALMKGSCDLAIFTSLYNRDDQLIVTPLQHSNRVFIMPKEYHLKRFAQQKEGFPYPWIPYSVLENERFIAPLKDEDGHLYFRRVMQEFGFFPTFVLRTDNFDTMLRNVESGLGIALTTDQYVDSSLTERFDLYSFGDKPESCDLVIAYNKSHHLNKGEILFIKECQDYYRSRSEAETTTNKGT